MAVYGGYLHGSPHTDLNDYNISILILQLFSLVFLHFREESPCGKWPSFFVRPGDISSVLGLIRILILNGGMIIRG